MNIYESVKSAISNVFANKMRAVLTMLGIIIGIAAVIMITSIGKGSTQQITTQLSSLGVGRLTVSTRASRTAGGASLTMDDYNMLKEMKEIKLVSPTYNLGGMSLKLLDPKETATATISGVSEDYKEITNPTLLYGRYISENDVDNSNKVVVINDTTAEKVFGYCDESVLGQRISIKTWRGNQKFTVIGILENTNASIEAMYGSEYPENIVVPITALLKMSISKNIPSLTLIVANENMIDETSKLITTTLDEAHKTTDGFYVQNIMQQMEAINSTIGLVTTFISCVAAISLVVGGIGVMNIMLVTVTERTREIGIRKSIGARNKDIRIQFIIEAVIITGIGGVIGILLGAVGGSAISGIMGIEAVLSVDAVAIAVIASSVIGMVFGVYPANKAAKLNPIEALRYE